MSSSFPLTQSEAVPDGSVVAANTLDTVCQTIRKDFDALLGLQVSTSLVVAQAIGPALTLTNKTGGNLANGNVVALDTGNNSAVALSDVQGSLRPLVVYVGNATLADGSGGPFLPIGQSVQTVTAQGSIARGQYVRKSATTLAVEDAGITQAATTSPPWGACGVALSAAAAGVVVIGPVGNSTGMVLGSNAAEASTTTAAGDNTLRTISGFTVPVTDGLKVRGTWRKSAGAAVSVTITCKVNGGTALWASNPSSTGANQAQSGSFEFYIPPQAANYLRAGHLISTNGTVAGGQVLGIDNATDLPAAALTSVTIGGNSGSALVTFAVANITVELVKGS